MTINIILIICLISYLSPFMSYTKRTKLPKFSNLTLKYDLLTLKMTSGGADNDIVELAVLETHMDPEVMISPSPMI